MSQLKQLKQVTEVAKAASDTIEEVVNVSMDFFTGTSETNPYIKSATKKIKHIINFSDEINKSEFAEYLKASYYLEQYFEHNYDENGHEKKMKRFFSKVSVTVSTDLKSVTIHEKRGLFKKAINKVYNFVNNFEMEEFQIAFGINADTLVPSTIDDNIITLTGVQIAGGSVIKAILRGETYIDKYYDRVEKKIKSRFVTAFAKTLSAIMGVTGFVLALV